MLKHGFSNFKVKYRWVASFLLFIAASCSCALISCNLSDYKLDRVAYQLNNYNETNMLDDDFVSPIFCISKNDEKKEMYTNLFSNFYYNSFNGDIREQVVNQIYFNDYRLHLETQSTFSIESTESSTGGYYVDNGLYYAYYSDDILGTKGYMQTRYNCDTFSYVSDTFADKLVEFYGITGDDPYRTLITTEEYCVLPLTIDGTIIHKFCINNILYSTLRNGPRTTDLYGDFALFYYSGYVNSDLDLNFEIDLKDNAYCTKNVFKGVNKLGYTSIDTTFSFKTYDKSVGSYMYDENIANNYSLAWNNNNDAVVYIIYTIVLVIFVILLFWLFWSDTVHPKLDLLSFGICSLLFCVYGIVVSFIYNYPLFSIAPLVLIILIFVLSRKEIFDGAKMLIFRKPVEDSKKQKSDFYKIEI